MKTTHNLLLRLTILSLIMATIFAVPVNAGIIGDVPIIPIKRKSDDYNMLVGVGIENLWVTKGVVQAAEDDRFLIVVDTEFLRKDDGNLVAAVNPKDGGITKDEDAELRTGAYVKVLPILVEVPSTVGEAIKAVIEDGKTVLICEVTIQLVLVDVKGGRHVVSTATFMEEFKGGLPPEEPG